MSFCKPDLISLTQHAILQVALELAKTLTEFRCQVGDFSNSIVTVLCKCFTVFPDAYS